MLRRRVHRLSTTLFVVLSLLLAQLALARYVCPQQADMQAMLAMMEAGQPCDGMDPQQPALCHQHAADPAGAFEVLKLPAVAPAIVQVRALPLLPDLQPSCAAPPAAFSGCRPPPDPVFLATRRLRV